MIIQRRHVKSVLMQTAHHAQKRKALQQQLAPNAILDLYYQVQKTVEKIVVMTNTGIPQSLNVYHVLQANSTTRPNKNA